VEGWVEMWEAAGRVAGAVGRLYHAHTASSLDMPAYGSISQRTAAYGSIRQNTSAFVSIRQRIAIPAASSACPATDCGASDFSFLRAACCLQASRAPAPIYCRQYNSMLYISMLILVY
jgi:hypothetical protein